MNPEAADGLGDRGSIELKCVNLHGTSRWRGLPSGGGYGPFRNPRVRLPQTTAGKGERAAVVPFSARAKPNAASETAALSVEPTVQSDMNEASTRQEA